MRKARSSRKIRCTTVSAVTPIPPMLLEMMLGGGVLPMLEARGLIAPRRAVA